MAWVAVITEDGRGALTNYAGSGEPLIVDSVKLGKGSVSATPSSMREASALSDEVTSGIVESSEILAEGVKFNIRVGPYTESYELTEVGLFATDNSGATPVNTLLAYAVWNGEDGIEIPSVSTFKDFLYVLSLTLVIENDPEVSFSISQDTYLTQTELDAAMTAKVSVSQGSDKAGQFLVINGSGNVEPMSIGTWTLGGSY